MLLVTHLASVVASRVESYVTAPSVCVGACESPLPPRLQNAAISSILCNRLNLYYVRS